ncbi:MAG TPA: TonB-dependent receptor [Rhodothermales bacterium]|nr:TonB-dependent receptor [Rhodothermales bacterium]
MASFWTAIWLITATASAQQLTAFEIDAGPAAPSLNTYAHQANVQVGFTAELVKGIHTNAVKGTYEPMAALSLLLEGTGLIAEQGIQGIVIRNVQNVPSDSTQTDYPSAAMERSRKRRVNTEALPNNIEGIEAQPIEEILVTGSRIRGATRASPVVALTREDIDRGGFSTVGDLIESLPQNFGAGAAQDALNDRNASAAAGGSVDNITAGQSINLRGLGPGSTLVLLNGRRLSPSGLSARFTDVSRIPLSAVERVEVLTDGASAVYGSDAIGGVVNFILRDAYDGAETRVKYGSVTSGDMAEIVVSQAAGKAWTNGSVLASYEYYQRDSLASRDREFSASADLTSLGGSDWRQAGGNPANVEAGDETYPIPHEQDGTGLTPGDFSTNVELNLHDFRVAEDLLPRQERHSFFLHLAQDFGPAEAFGQLLLSRGESLYRIDQTLRSFDVPDSNPFFVDPTDSGLSTVFVSNYSLVDDIGSELVAGTTDSDGAVLGVRLNLFNRWSAEIAANWSKEESIQNARNSLNEIAFERALASSEPSLAFNPFGDGSHTGANVLAGLTTDTGGFTAEQELTSLELGLNGEILQLSNGRYVRLATGLELREESLATERRLGAEIEMPMVVPGLTASRDVFAGYAEVFIPIARGREPGSMAGRFELSLAGRYERYSDFGDTVDPKFGFVWSPSDVLTLRGTFGTSFRAPALWDLDTTAPGNSIIFLPQEFVDAGLIPFTALILRGGNENLKAEEATTWTAGIQLAPADGLSIDVTYFNVDFRNRIDLPFISLLDGFLPRFSSLMTVDPTLEQINEFASDTRYQESVFGTTTPAEDLTSGAVGVGGILNARRNNLSKSEVNGFELLASYRRETAIGAWELGFNGSFLFDFKRALLATDPLLEEVGTVGRPIDSRMRTNLTWIGNSWTVSGYVNYADGYTDQNSEPDRSVSSWTTVDLTVAYQLPRDSGLLSNTGLSFHAQNLLNEDPPFVDAFGAQGYDSANATGLGRFVSLQVTKEW